MHRRRHQRRRGHSARSVAHPADGPGASCGPPGQILGLTAADAEAVTMANTFTASKPGTQDPPGLAGRQAACPAHLIGGP